MPAPSNDIVPAFNTRCLGALRFSFIGWIGLKKSRPSMGGRLRRAIALARIGALWQAACGGMSQAVQRQFVSLIESIAANE
jgi:hypothetical protein